jgi:hypothetical protein
MFLQRSLRLLFNLLLRYLFIIFYYVSSEIFFTFINVSHKPHYSYYTNWTTGESGFDSPQGQIFFLCSTVSRPKLGPTQWVPRLFSRVQIGRGVKLVTHLHLLPKLWMCGAIPPLLHASSCRRNTNVAQGQLYLLTYCYKRRKFVPVLN